MPLFTRILLLSSLALAGCFDPTPPDSTIVYDPTVGNRYDAPLSISDTRVQNIALNGLLPGSSPCHDPAIAVIDDVIDGATLHGSIPADGLAYDIHLIGVSVPAAGMTPACFGNESRAFSELLRNRVVALSFDGTCTDDMGALLAYLWIGPGPGDLWQRQLLQRGFARAAPGSANTSFDDDFAANQDAAQAQALGLWTCP